MDEALRERGKIKNRQHRFIINIFINFAMLLYWDTVYTESGDTGK